MNHGGIQLDITAQDQKLQAAVKRSEKTLGKFGSHAGRQLAGVAKKFTLLGAAAAAAGAAVVAGFIMSSMKSIDAMAKLSDRIGVDIRDLQKLRHAAELTGAGAAAMDDALEQMSRRLSEASQGSGEAAKAVQALGLDLDWLLSLDPATAFAEIAEAVSRLPRQADKARVAYQLFGRQGVKLVNTLDLGKAGLKATGDELERLGGVIGRVDAAKIEKANDALETLGTVLKTQVSLAAAEAAPEIEAVTKAVTDLAVEALKALPRLRKLFGDPKKALNAYVEAHPFYF